MDKTTQEWLDVPLLWIPTFQKEQKAAVVAECNSTFDAFAQIESWEPRKDGILEMLGLDSGL